MPKGISWLHGGSITTIIVAIWHPLRDLYLGTKDSRVSIFLQQPNSKKDNTILRVLNSRKGISPSNLLRKVRDFLKEQNLRRDNPLGIRELNINKFSGKNILAIKTGTLDTDLTLSEMEHDRYAKSVGWNMYGIRFMSTTKTVIGLITI